MPKTNKNKMIREMESLIEMMEQMERDFSFIRKRTVPCACCGEQIVSERNFRSDYPDEFKLCCICVDSLYTFAHHPALAHVKFSITYYIQLSRYIYKHLMHRVQNAVTSLEI